MPSIAQICVTQSLNSIAIGHGHFNTATTNCDGSANLPVCPNLTASKRSDADGTILGYVHKNIAPLVLVEVWAAQQHRPTLVEPRRAWISGRLKSKVLASRRFLVY